MAVPVDLSGSGLERAVVEAARERVHERARKAADTRDSAASRPGRFWLLSGGMARCAVCGNGLAVHSVHRNGKVHCYYRCYTRYNAGLDVCSNYRHNPAAPLEEEIWFSVRCLLSRPERLVQAYGDYLDRRRKSLRGNPERETKELAERLAEVDEERRGYLRQNARGVLADADLDAMLVEVDERREGLCGALAEARDRRQQLEALQSEQEKAFGGFYAIRNALIHDRTPEERRRILQALRITVEVDVEGNARIKGIFDQDLTELLPVEGVHSVRTHDEPVPDKDYRDYKGVVTLDSSRRPAVQSDKQSRVGFSLVVGSGEPSVELEVVE